MSGVCQDNDKQADHHYEEELSDQTKDASRATTDELVLPATVTVAMAELAGAVREGLLALAVGAGLQVMQALMAEDVAAVCGPIVDGAITVCPSTDAVAPARNTST